MPFFDASEGIAGVQGEHAPAASTAGVKVLYPLTVLAEVGPRGMRKGGQGELTDVSIAIGPAFGEHERIPPGVSPGDIPSPFIRLR